MGYEWFPGLTLRMCMAARSTPNSLLFLYCSKASSSCPHASRTAARLKAISPSSGERDDATLNRVLEGPRKRYLNGHKHTEGDATRGPVCSQERRCTH